MAAQNSLQHPEDSDGLSASSANSRLGGETAVSDVAPTAPVDLNTAEYGPLFFVEEDNVYGNQLAIAATFAGDHQIRFDPESGVFKGYSATTGTWAMLHEPDVKRLLANCLSEK